jgi:hypothetical protein
VGACNYPTATQIYMGYVSFVWTFDQIREQLLPHRHTLQELRIRLIGPTQEGLARFDINAFDKLRTLQLCGINVPSPDKACNLWLTPSLERIALEHSHTRPSTGTWGYCENRDVAWYAAFAQVAADCRKAGTSGLRTLELICDTRLNEEKWPLSSGSLAAYQAEISKQEANIAKVKGIVESFGFEFVRRREPCIGKGDRELCISKGDREIV